MVDGALAAQTAAPASSSPAAPAQTPHFDIREYRVLGNTVLSNRAIEGVLYPRLGPDKTFTDVDAARAALEAAYHAAGYATVFVDVPPQQVEEGVVRLHVTEGRLRQRTISGARYFSEPEILSQLPATTPGTVPQLPVLQAELTALNTQTADRTVVPVLKAGPTPGTMDLALNVTDHLPLHGSLEVDNEYSPDTHPLRLTGALSYSNLFADLDAISLLYTATPQQWSQVGVLNLGYSSRPFDEGMRLSGSFTNSSSSVATVGTLGVLGRGQVYSGRFSAPILQLPGNNQSITLGLDYKDFLNSINLADIGVQVQPVAYFNASVAYAGGWQRTDHAGQVAQFWTLDLAANFGPRGVLSSSATQFDTIRFQARSNYSYLRSDASLTSRLPLNLQLTLRAAGQIASGPLVAYEQFSISGFDGVRGYLEAEVLGDSAVKGTVQLQLPPLTHRGSVLAAGFVFFDAGSSTEIDALPGEPAHTALRSGGVGLILAPGRRLTGSLTWADPLVAGPRTRAYDSRVLFDFKGSF
jgi:hemolysin activation/secretion protein